MNKKNISHIDTDTGGVQQAVDDVLTLIDESTVDRILNWPLVVEACEQALYRGGSSNVPYVPISLDCGL